MKRKFKQVEKNILNEVAWGPVRSSVKRSVRGSVDLLIWNTVVIPVRTKVDASVRWVLKIGLEFVTDEFVHAKKIQTNK